MINQKQTVGIGKRAKLIYNPHAGLKRKFFTTSATLEDIHVLLDQYQIPVDFVPTQYPGHATELARASIEEGYKLVLVAGGDGTVGEVANGLIRSPVTLGILPLGSFMNIARMLAIPTDLEKAVQLIKIGRTRKIDVGCITTLSGEPLQQPYYFLENAGIGIEAEVHDYFLQVERGNSFALIAAIKAVISYYHYKAKIIIDDKEMETRAPVVTISNGPFTGAAFELAPKAKLNDHRLTVRTFSMGKVSLAFAFLRLLLGKKILSKQVKSFQAKSVKIISAGKHIVHADARLFGTTPIDCRIVPNALTLICGFAKNGHDIALKKRTYLDP